MDIGKANDLESVCTINLHNLSLIVHEMHSYAVKKRNERKKKITLQDNPGVFFVTWSGRRDSNPWSHTPEACAITKLRYFPMRSLL